MTTKEMIAVMQAYEDGKEIEWQPKSTKYSDDWIETAIPVWDWDNINYRIKPEPEYVPYDSVTEVEKDKWVKCKSNGKLYRITELDSSDNPVKLNCGWRTFKDLFEYYAYEDGTPCGKRVEE